MAESLESRIQKRAFEIWEREGRPEGRAHDNWELAREEIAIEDNYRSTLLPNPSHGPDDTAERTEPVEPVLSIASQGEMPGIADQGEEFRIPGAVEDDPLAEPAGTEPMGTETAGTARRSRAPRRSRRGS